MARPKGDAKDQRKRERASRDFAGPIKLRERNYPEAEPMVAKALLTFEGGSKLMNWDEASIFDLSPSEKLQLVEDLWDDLAATPDAVPVHDWQKDELARRKANLLSKPGSALSWEEVQRRVRSRYGR